MTPIIVYSRTSVDPRTDIPKLKAFHEEDNRIRLDKKYTKQNKYDSFSILTNQIPQTEYYTIPVPDYVTANYDMIIWCDYITQLNTVVEGLIHWQGHAWGDTYKYITKIDSYNFETGNATGEDRVSKCTLSLKTFAYILPKDLSDRPTMEKLHTKTKLIIGEGTYDPNNDKHPIDNRNINSNPNLH